MQSGVLVSPGLSLLVVPCTVQLFHLQQSVNIQLSFESINIQIDLGKIQLANSWVSFVTSKIHAIKPGKIFAAFNIAINIILWLKLDN